MQEEFREILVDDEGPEHRDSHASSSHEVFLEPTSKRREDWGENIVKIHFAEDEIARFVRGPKLQGPHAEDAMPKPYLEPKIVNLETITDTQSWCRSWPPNGSSRIRVKLKLRKKHSSLQKFLEPERNPKVIYTDTSLEFGKACEDLSWNHCTSTPHRSESNGFAERAVRRVTEGTSALLLQSGLDENW